MTEELKLKIKTQITLNEKTHVANMGQHMFKPSQDAWMIKTGSN